MTDGERITFCRICEAACGLRVRVEDDRVAEIRPDDDHPVSRGYACIKGIRYRDLHESPDRLTHPLKRVAPGRFERVSWEQALREIGERVRRIRAAHGRHAVGMYIGNPVAFSATHPIFAHGFGRALGTRNIYSAGSQDCNNKFAVAERMYGSPTIQPIPDFDRTECFIIVGSNPAVSHMSFVNAPRPIERLRALEQRGGAVWFVNPRRTESASQVGRQVFIRPDTDVFFLLGFLSELLATDGVDRQRVARHMRGLEEVEELARQWAPERTAEVTGIPTETLREMVASYRQARGAALYCSTGLNQTTQSTLAFWLLNVINAVSGNLDREGGMVVSRGILPLPRLLKRLGFGHSSERSRIGDYPSVLETLPAAVIPDEVETPGPDRLRAMFVTAGNPVLSCADEERMRGALEQLELVVSIDMFRNETGNLSDYVLPAPSFLERADIPLSVHGFQPVPYLQYTEPVVPPSGEQREEWWIFSELAEACDVPLFGVGAARAALGLSRRMSRLPVIGSRLSLSTERMLAPACAAAGWTIRSLKRRPSGVLLADNRGDDFLGKRVLTDDGRVDLAPADFVAGAREDLPAEHERHRAEAGVLRLISKRERLGHNTWMHNLEHFVRGDRATNYLYMHPDDAAAAGVGSGDLAEVRAGAACLRVPVRVTDEMMPGSVALPHGWGHQQADGLAVAQRAPGVNPNRLARSGPEGLERFTGMTVLNGIAVEVRPAQRDARPVEDRSGAEA